MKSIRRHLTLILVPALAGLLAGTGLLVWIMAREALTSQFDNSLLQRARILAINIEEDDGALEIDKNLMEHGQKDESLTQAVFDVHGPDGQLLLTSSADSGRRLPALPFPGERAEPEFHAVRLPDGRPGRAVVMGFDAADDKKGLFRNLTLAAALPAPDIAGTLRTLAGVLAASGGVALALLVPLLHAALGRGLQPLRTLAERTAAIDARRLDTRLPREDCPAELAPVITTLNALLERLEESFARERRFSSDVAHELRTPVAELRSLGELVAGWPQHATPESFADVLSIAREMEEVVSRLTLLSRADAGTQPVMREPVDLTALTCEILDRHTAAAERRGITFRRRLAPVTVEGDPALWRMILTNLAVNASGHPPAGSTVTVELSPAALTLANPAPDLTGEDMPRLFDRFWRKDGARSGYGHSGLGLSLVRALTELMGLPAPRARLTDDRQLELRLPLSSPGSGSRAKPAGPGLGAAGPEPVTGKRLPAARPSQMQPHRAGLR